jgi:hypothetical protein
MEKQENGCDTIYRFDFNSSSGTIRCARESCLESSQIYYDLRII